MITEFPPVKTLEDRYFEDVFRNCMLQTEAIARLTALETPNFIKKCKGLPPDKALTALLTHAAYEELKPFMGRKFDIDLADREYCMSVEVRGYFMHEGNSIGIRIKTSAKNQLWLFRTNLDFEVYPIAKREELGRQLNFAGDAFKMFSVFVVLTTFLLVDNKDAVNRDSVTFLAPALLFLSPDFGVAIGLLDTICLDLAKHNHLHTVTLKNANYATGSIILLTILFMLFMTLSGYLSMNLSDPFSAFILIGLLFICTIPVALANKIRAFYLNQLLPHHVTRGTYTW